MPASVQKHNPRKLQKHTLKQEPFHLAVLRPAALSHCSVLLTALCQQRRAEGGSSQEGFLQADAEVFAQHIPVALGHGQQPRAS